MPRVRPKEGNGYLASMNLYGGTFTPSSAPLNSEKRIRHDGPRIALDARCLNFLGWPPSLCYAHCLDGK